MRCECCGRQCAEFCNNRCLTELGDELAPLFGDIWREIRGLDARAEFHEEREVESDALRRHGLLLAERGDL